MLHMLGFLAATGALSPESDARAKGLHYTVKERRHGYECLICGKLGDIAKIRASPCVPPTTPTPSLNAVCEKSWEAQQMQIENDQRLAQELHDLQVEEENLTQLLLLQQLENEEKVLQELLKQQESLAVAEAYAAAALKSGDGKSVSNKAVNPMPEEPHVAKPTPEEPKTATRPTAPEPATIPMAPEPEGKKVAAHEQQPETTAKSSASVQQDHEPQEAQESVATNKPSQPDEEPQAAKNPAPLRKAPTLPYGALVGIEQLMRVCAHLP